jgi:hypothetical protein
MIRDLKIHGFECGAAAPRHSALYVFLQVVLHPRTLAGFVPLGAGVLEEALSPGESVCRLRCMRALSCCAL